MRPQGPSPLAFFLGGARVKDEGWVLSNSPRARAPQANGTGTTIGFGNASCTMMLANQSVFNFSLPGYPGAMPPRHSRTLNWTRTRCLRISELNAPRFSHAGGGYGLSMAVSRNQCLRNASSCCMSGPQYNGTVCALWAGARLVRPSFCSATACGRLLCRLTSHVVSSAPPHLAHPVSAILTTRAGESPLPLTVYSGQPPCRVAQTPTNKATPLWCFHRRGSSLLSWVAYPPPYTGVPRVHPLRRAGGGGSLRHPPRCEASSERERKASEASSCSFFP